MQLGAGQYGRVFRATTKPDDGGAPLRLAIKSIDRQSLCDVGGNMDEKKKSYVESEIRVMQSVEHPNIVRLYEPLYSETNIFLVLEYCDLDLSKYMNGNKFSTPQIRPRAPLSEIEAQGFMRHLAAGLQHLREHNVVHRDLKPENLLLSGSLDAGFTLKIADFGMARTLEGAQQLANTMCGSPAFMAPEVFLMRQRGQPGYDDKADLWSVGCILYFMLTKNMVTPAQNHVHLAQELQVRET
jgi:serine/threonine-protein kinase ULK/ATG1